jgi:hypothetical protein
MCHRAARVLGLQGLLGADTLSQFGAITLDCKHQMLVVHAR